MSLPVSSSSSRHVELSGRAPITEFDVLKQSHRFLRDEDERDEQLSWGDQVAKKYYSTLYREFAVCDLKHYKSGNFALRWRTENEVLLGAGEETCGNTRCFHHESSKALPMPALKTLELPFSYEENGKMHTALVKVVLCDRCVKKLLWKRNNAKKTQSPESSNNVAMITEHSIQKVNPNKIHNGSPGKEDQSSARFVEEHSEQDNRRRRRSSRSRSPRRKHNKI